MFTFPFTLPSSDGFSNTLSTAFDGGDDIAEVTPNAALGSGITTKLTVAVWIKAAAQNATGIIGHFLEAGSQRKWILLSITGGLGRWILSANGASLTKDFRTSVVVFDSAWHLVGFTYDGDAATTSQIKIYNDGVIDPSPTKTKDDACTSLHNSTGDVSIGGWAGTGSYIGNVDEPTVWDVAFSATDWTNLYNSGVPNNPKTHAKSANLAAFWKMGDGDTHPTILDQEGSNDLTMTGMAAEDFVADVP